MGYEEWVNAVERLCDSCQWGSITVCMPSLATITQPQYSVNSLILTHSNLQVSWCYICLYFAKRDFIPNIWKFWLGLIISGKNWYVRNKFPTCDASTSFGQPQWPWKWPSQFHLFNFTLQNVVENWNYFLQANFSEKKNVRICFSILTSNNSEILQTWILISSFQVVPGHRIEEQICMFVFWEKLRLNFFFSRSTDL